MPPGSVLFSSRAPIGYVVIAAAEVCTNQGFKSIIPNENIYNEYLYYYLLSSKQRATKVASGTTFKEISLKVFADLPFPLPPLATQQAIVAKIEELFSELDKGIESIKLAQQQLKTYRQSVLKAAFEGNLTPSPSPEGEGSKMPQGELPAGWKWVKSAELFDFVTSGSRGWAKYYANDGAIFIRITNLDFDSLELDLEPAKIQYVQPPKNAEGLRTKVQEGDFLISITGYLGMFAIAPKLDNAYINQHIALCRPKPGFNKQYVGYWIIAKSGGHHHLNKMTKGATKAGLGLDDIKNFPVPMAPIEQQQAIVAAIESRLSVADQLEATLAQSLAQAEALRQSVLKKAFEGRLV
ncbi:MAG: restriction endonuclease subunit S [Spirochaetota bacterium]